MTHNAFRPFDRREFLGQLGLASAAIAGAASITAVAAEEQPGAQQTTWDMSWLALLAAAQYKVVFDANAMSDGLALELSADFLDQYHEVHNTRDDQTRAVIVMRQLGTSMAFNDAMWGKYPLGARANITDPATHAPVKHNPFYKEPSGPPEKYPPAKLETLQKRGTIVLVCNRATNNIAGTIAEQLHLDPADVRAEFRGNLVPGAILMPSGIFSLIRAQNAGCAYMRGS